jgi:arginase
MTGFLDGMGLTTALGLCWRDLAATVPGFEPVLARMTFLLGARDLDPAEVSWLRQSEVTSVRVEQVPNGLPVLLEAAPIADAIGYMHLDLDVLDPAVGRANYLPVPQGLSLEQLTGAIAAVRRRVPLAAATVASYSPDEDRDQGVCRAAFAAITAMLA